jgi:branched-chain amino acid transport system ATP-binding protein
MLDIRSVSKTFGGAVAVADVSLTIKAGEIAGLIGPNGAGKTTLFNLIAGALKPTSGDILLLGEPITREAPYRRIGRGLARTFQIPRPFGEMTVIENLLTGAKAQSGERMLANWIVPGRIAREERANAEKAMALLDFVGLAQLAREPARVLSGGQRKLLELARVLMAEPSIILLDEPGAGVNPALLESIMSRIAEINARGVTFLIIEHNMDLVSRLCRHVYVMSQGRLLYEGAPSEVVRNAEVIDAYLGGGHA